MKKHYNLKISGKVQGVWYRVSTRNMAAKLGINGFVKNESDGSVYAEVEGNEKMLDALVKWCKEGPAFANVKAVKVSEGELVGFEGFEIKG